MARPLKLTIPDLRYCNMEINPLANIASSIQDMGQMLRQMNEAKLALDDKMLEAAAADEAAPSAGGIDTYA